MKNTNQSIKNRIASFFSRITRLSAVCGVLFALICVFALSVKLELSQGITVLERLSNTFNVNIPLQAAGVLFFFVAWIYFFKHYEKFDVFTLLISLLLSGLYMLCTYYEKYDSSFYLYGSGFQRLINAFALFGMTIGAYVLLTCILELSKREVKADSEKNFFLQRNYFLLSSVFIFACWLFYLINNYPGDMNPDSVLQLKYFLGDEQITAWHPPLSTLLMGGLFQIGRKLIDANFGIFFYGIFQSILGALVFSYGLDRLRRLKVPFTFLLGATAYFGFLPLWGFFAQWFEKDFLYTVSTVFFLIVLMNIYVKRECSKKDFWWLLFSSLLMCFLRNNGIFACVPALFAMGIFLKKASKRRIFTALIAVFFLYEGTTRMLYPVLNIGRTSVAESMGIMFSQTARYAVTYSDEITSEEKEILDQNFQGMEHLQNYEPRIVDPVKIYYNHSDFKGYLKVYFSQMKKHPGVYLEALMNGAFGYLAPVKDDIGASANGTYDSYVADMGVSHVRFSEALSKLYGYTVNIKLLNLLIRPGLYTFIGIILVWLLAKRKQASVVILCIPSIVNVLVCVASPLACSMRYALPTVASVPFLIGITLFYTRRVRKS